jgi:KTSC domain
MAMKNTLVGSTTLLSVAYDEARELLELECGGHAVYRYFAVPASVPAGLLSAVSKGACFNEAIRRYRFARLPERRG